MSDERAATNWLLVALYVLLLGAATASAGWSSVYLVAAASLSLLPLARGLSLFW